MILPKIKDEIARSIGGNKETQGSIIDPKFLDAAIISYRAEIAYRNYKRDNGLSDIYYQRINLIYENALQSSAPDCSVIFTIPPFIKLGSYDGIGYCGGRNGQTPWIRIHDTMELARLQGHPITKLDSNPNLVYFLPLYTQRLVAIYNCPMVKEGMIRGVVNDPCQVTEFNKDIDDYPIDEGDVVELIELVKRDIITNKAFKPAIEWNQPSGEAEHPFKQTVNQPAAQ